MAIQDTFLKIRIECSCKIVYVGSEKKVCLQGLNVKMITKMMKTFTKLKTVLLCSILRVLRLAAKLEF